MDKNIKYSIQLVSERRAQKKAELKASKERIQEITQDLFAPPETKNKMDLLMHHFNTGMAAYDGIMTGIKIYKRIKSAFTRKNTAKNKSRHHHAHI